jgi:hypothetical protein
MSFGATVESMGTDSTASELSTEDNLSFFTRAEHAERVGEQDKHVTFA